MRTIQTGRKCIVRCSGSGVGRGGREDRPVPARGGAIPVMELRSVFTPGREPVSFLISFTSGIPVRRCYET